MNQTKIRDKLRILAVDIKANKAKTCWILIKLVFAKIISVFK